ncbi:DUF2207 domain-containing protein [Microbacterium faecale]|uniref:DUF2207 domain-containing protein n=1 Tax=Microbacterium faecale TaxID=1804630 RepID=UPI00166B7A2C|nr:DUF2207 domain-containing protein [Microbacterium faecale]
MEDPNALIGFLAIGILLALVGLIIIAITKPIQRHLPSSPTVLFTPPPGDVFEHGLALRADRRVLSAALTGLAVARRIRILAPRGRRGPVAVEVVDKAGLTPREHAFLSALRPGKLRPRQQRRYLRALRDIGIEVPDAAHAPDVFFVKGRAAFRRRQRKQLTRVIDETRREMRRDDLVRRGSGSFHLVLLSLIFLATAVLGAVLILGAILEGAWLGVVVVFVDIALVFWVLTLAPPPLLRFTDRGRALRTHLSGLRSYVRLAEGERMRALQSMDGALRTGAGEATAGGRALGISPRPTAADPVAQAQLDRYVLIERLLPYAILFRQERSWQREFQHVGGAPDLAQNVRVLGATLNGLMAVLEVLVIIGKVGRAVGLVLSFFARS